MSAIDRWAINESLLQSYRSTFISSQSFLLAVGTIAVEKSLTLVCITAAVSVLVIWFIWFPVVRARHRIVDYHKFSSHLADKPDHPPLCSEHDYVHNEALRNQANAIFGIRTNWRKTRVKLDLVLPILFTIIWAALVGYAVSHA